ncbi:MAG: 2-C-methyl-D-erythritol 4-phosphate cytidylyltransferase [Muribaculaceae bacterium]|nr:2-C-methyl-D-erythritol 4-phosphate cytidylyltransferase [Muribaculaceae bacterium]
MKIHVIIVAGGSGSRFGSDVPKQYCLLAGKPVVMHAIGRFRSALPGTGITLVVAPEMHGYWNELCEQYGFDSPAVVHGGASRSDSVRNAVLSLPEVPDVIMVHDGARPLVSASVIEGVLHAMKNEAVDGAIPAVAVTDSLRYGDSAEETKAVDRSLYHAVQTPQAFRGRHLVDAYRNNKQNFSDDASLMEHCGRTRIVLTTGSTDNIKITNPKDLAVAGVLMAGE